MKCITCYQTDGGKNPVRIWPNGRCGYCIAADDSKDKPKYACKSCGSTTWHQLGTRDGVESCSECGYRPSGHAFKDKMERDIYAAYGSGLTYDKTIQAHRFNRAKTEASLGPAIKTPPPEPTV